MAEEEASRRALLGAAVGLGALAAAATAEAADLKTPAEPRTRKLADGRFAGKVVLITGATSGIGKATAHAFAMEGAKVMFCGRRETLGAEVQAAIRAARPPTSAPTCRRTPTWPPWWTPRSRPTAGSTSRSTTPGSARAGRRWGR